MPNINEHVKVEINTRYGKIEEVVVISLFDADGYFLAEVTKGVFRGYRVRIHKSEIVQEKTLIMTAKEARELSLKNIPVALKKIEGWIKDKANEGLTELAISDMWINVDIINELVSNHNYCVTRQIGNGYKISW